MTKKTETATQRKRRLEKQKIYQLNRRNNETPSQKQDRLRKLRERYKARKDEETYEHRQERLVVMSARQAEKISHETEAEHESRLHLLRQNVALRLAQETIEQRASRLAEIFQRNINVCADKTCEVCLKLCYPNQVNQVAMNLVKVPAYLPVELAQKTSLQLCHRCKTHLTSKNKQPPAKSYWNDLHPGEIPLEIASLTQVEQRLLSRVIPFVKIIKLSGLFGQYGFKGQAILFAQDIFEVTERLPNMLPRLPETSGIVVVTEELENLNITREFSISKERVNSAINWLIRNNPLYSDVINVTDQVNLDESQIVRKDTPQQDESVDRDVGNSVNENLAQHPHEYKSINGNSRVIRASWNQADGGIFNPVYTGVQCCAMALSAIVKSSLLPPSHWNKNICNQVLIEGDKLYETIRVLSTQNDINIPNSGYLNVQNFNVVKDNIKLFGNSFTLQYDDDAEVFGNLDDRLNIPEIGFTLLNGLQHLFVQHTTGILIVNGKCYAVIKSEGKFYFCDSHSCGPKGAPAGNGCACVIECDSIQELVRICKRAIGGSKNVQYTLDFVTVERKTSNTMHHAPTHPNQQLGEESSETAKRSRRNTSSNSQQATLPINTSVMLPIDCHQAREESVLQEVPEDVANLNKIVRKTTDNIVNEAHEEKAEEFAWFFLFPKGKNGLKEKRKVKISPLDYFQFRILGSDLRFQRNDYLFYALSMYEFYRIKSNISVCGKKIQQDGSKVEDVHLYVKNLRGSSAYWRTALNELIAQIRCLGPPHYFMTLSCNDLHWPDMISALLKANRNEDTDPSKLTIYEVQNLIELYPTVVSRHFMIRVNAFLSYMKANDQLFSGKLIDYWWRIEFQNRGSPHLHMVIWVEGTPDFNTDEGIQRINDLITCELPESDDLKQLVQSLQIHRHTPTCNKNSPDSCRFNFPRQPSETTKIVAHTSEEFIRNGGRLCTLKRAKGEEFVNNYNPIVLRLWGANMDIQPCGSNESIAFYIAKYISKNEPTEMESNLTEAINRIRREEGEISRKLFHICMTLLNQRQVSACECVYRLCHLQMREGSRKCIFLNTRMPEQRYNVLAFGSDDAAIGFCSNIFQRYQNRPTAHQNYDFENMSLMEFAMLFEPHYARKVDQMEEDTGDADAYEQPAEETSTRLINLLDNSKMKIRTRPAVVRVPYFTASSDPNNYYYSLLAQYAPFREEIDLLAGFDNSKAAFLAKEESLKQSSAHMEVHRERDRELENAFNQVHALEQLENHDPPQDEDFHDFEGEFQMGESDFRAAQQAMNTEQRELYNFITRNIRNQLEGKSSERVKLFITGGAGTGKTFTLKLLRENIRRCYGGEKVSVKVAALTGVAAKLIQGHTLHSILKLPVQKDGKLVNPALLSGEYLKQMRRQWKDVQFIIIDEISMVPYEMLCMIDQRLKQLMDNLSLFGGLNVLFFGDLLQLPPVRGHAIFEQPEKMKPATHLWREFSLCELSQNMRQQGDQTFIEMLNDLRVGQLKSDHINILLQKLQDNNCGEFAVDKALRIYPTVRQVDDHNKQVLQHYSKQNVDMCVITAQDKIVDFTRKMDNIEIETLIPSDINKTGGLPKQLTLFQGARVMLRYNIDVGKGLVNGAMGQVTNIIWPLFRRAQLNPHDIPSVEVNFGDIGVHRIQPKTVQFPAKYSSGTAERRMLPLILCWASTVHKMQGSTVNFAVINLGSKVFAPGQAYVALSRVTSLDGVKLEELDCAKITGNSVCSKTALDEMNRLRQLVHYCRH